MRIAGLVPHATILLKCARQSHRAGALSRAPDGGFPFPQAALFCCFDVPRNSLPVQKLDRSFILVNPCLLNQGLCVGAKTNRLQMTECVAHPIHRCGLHRQFPAGRFAGENDDGVEQHGRRCR